MADIKLSTVAGAGGVFHTEAFVFNQIINSGQTGDLVVIGTVGKITQLTHLLTTAVGTQAGISVDVDGVLIVNPTTLSGTGINGVLFCVLSESGATSSQAQVSRSFMKVIQGEIITIKKNAGNTTQSIHFSYITGVIK